MSFSVVIPSRNSANLVPCVQAVRKHEPSARIIVVDDGVSWDDAVMRALPAVGIVQGDKPFVFARNVNIGIEATRGKIEVTSFSDASPRFIPGPYRDDVVILNDDALLETPGGFSLLSRAAEEHPAYGIIAATCNNVGNRNQWQLGIGLREDPRMVCFVAVLIPRRTIETVGLLDTRYVGYGCDDDDYSFSVRKAGLKIGIHDGCYVDHGSLTSSFRGAAGAGGDYRPNLKLFIEKWGTDNWGQPKATSQFRELFPRVECVNALQ